MAVLVRTLLLIVQFGLCFAQTTIIDVPFFNTSSQPVTAAVHYVESYTTILSFSYDLTTSDSVTSCVDNSAFPYYTLTMAPVLDVMTYSIAAQHVDGYPCWLVPEGSSSIAVCDMRMYEQMSTTISHLATLPVTITSGVEKLASAEADTTGAVPNIAFTTLKVPMPTMDNKGPNYASVVHYDDTATTFTFSGNAAPAGDWFSQALTLGASTWNFVYYDDTFTAAMDCAFAKEADGSATCVESILGHSASDPGIETVTYDAASFTTLGVTVTQKPFAAQTTIEVGILGFAQNVYTITASIVSVDEKATSLSFKLGAGPNHDAFYKQALLFGPSTYEETYASDRATYSETCKVYSGGLSAACARYGSGPDVEGPSTWTYTYPNTKLGVSKLPMDMINVTITAGAEKLPAYTPTTTQGNYRPSASPGSASTGALPSATDSPSGSPDRPAFSNASLAGILLMMAAVCLL